MRVHRRNQLQRSDIVAEVLADRVTRNAGCREAQAAGEWRLSRLRFIEVPAREHVFLIQVVVPIPHPLVLNVNRGDAEGGWARASCPWNVVIPVRQLQIEDIESNGVNVRSIARYPGRRNEWQERADLLTERRYVAVICAQRRLKAPVERSPVGSVGR